MVMGIKFTELQCKEVICVSDGARLGYIADIVAEVPQGVIAAIVVPGKPRLWGLTGQKEDYVIPWACVKKVGPDIVLVDIRPQDCRVPRPKPKFPL